MLMHAKDRAPAACSIERVQQQQQQPAVPLQLDVTRRYGGLVTSILVPSSHFHPRKSGRTNSRRVLFGGSRAFGTHTSRTTSLARKASASTSSFPSISVHLRCRVLSSICRSFRKPCPNATLQWALKRGLACLKGVPTAGGPLERLFCPSKPTNRCRFLHKQVLSNLGREQLFSMSCLTFTNFFSSLFTRNKFTSRSKLLLCASVHFTCTQYECTASKASINVQGLL